MQNFTLKSIYKLAWPAIISHATVMFISIIDLLFISHIHHITIAITAIAVANNICAATYAFLEGIRTGTTVLVSRFFGAQENDRISQTFNLALISALSVGFMLILIAPFVTPIIFRIIGNGKMATFGVPYLTIRLIGLPFHLIIFACIGLFRGLKNTTFPFLITIAICLCNITLNYLFMHNYKSIAFSTVLTLILGAALSLLLLITLPFTRIYINVKKSFHPITKPFVKLAAEIGLYAGSLVIAFALFSLIFTNLGNTIMTAHQIVLQIFLATYLAPMGFFVAATILIGKLLGENRHKFVIQATRKVFYASLPLVGGISLTVAFFAPQIAHFFSPTDPTVVQLTISSIYLICLTQLFSASYLILKGALTAAKDTRFVFLAGTASSYLFFLPLAYLLSVPCGYGLFGGYFAFLLWTMLDTVVFSWRLCHIHKIAHL